MKQILFLPGDGIGVEVLAQAKRVWDACSPHMTQSYEVVHALIGGAAIDAMGHPYPKETQTLARQSAAVMLGAVGGPKWEKRALHERPEKGLLSIRSDLNCFANLRPARLFPGLEAASTLKPEIVSNLDLLIVRELIGGIYFGEPRGRTALEGFNTMRYSVTEVERIAHVAFQSAQQRGSRLCSVDKSNVLEVSQLWRDTVESVSAAYPDVTCTHMLVDNCAMQLVRAPKAFDVILTSNLFGDILSDCAAMLTGSIGMLPSASLNEHQVGIYEPVHGSAPDIAGQDIANPIATILSLGMMCRYSLGEVAVADAIEAAVGAVIKAGLRTKDMVTGSEQPCGTHQMGTHILQAIQL